MSDVSYSPTEYVQGGNVINYLFDSTGAKNIVKLVEYRYFKNWKGKRMFNLGFGDYDLINDTVSDSTITDNGDVYKVFNTVLNTIPLFFGNVSNAVVMIQGSDTGEKFVTHCKLHCIKNCRDNKCKNENRRIKVYQNYVNKNFETLKGQYTFYGSVKTGAVDTDIEDYIPYKNYESVFVVKNIL